MILCHSLCGYPKNFLVLDRLSSDRTTQIFLRIYFLHHEALRSRLVRRAIERGQINVAIFSWTKMDRGFVELTTSALGLVVGLIPVKEESCSNLNTFTRLSTEALTIRKHRHHSFALCCHLLRTHFNRHRHRPLMSEGVN